MFIKLRSRVFRSTVFFEKHSLSVDKQYLSNRKAEFFDKLCFSIEKNSFLKICFSLINCVYRLEKLCFSIWKTMFFRNSTFHSINWVFRDKLCFSSEKQWFSIEKHCLSAINSVFRFITHLACHSRGTYLFHWQHTFKKILFISMIIQFHALVGLFGTRYHLLVSY